MIRLLAYRLSTSMPFYPINMNMDKRFFQLIFTPYFSSAMGLLDGADIARYKIDQHVMIDRLKAMSAKTRQELLLGLAQEKENTIKKLPSIPADLRDAFKMKIAAIQDLLDEF